MTAVQSKLSSEEYLEGRSGHFGVHIKYANKLNLHIFWVYISRGTNENLIHNENCTNMYCLELHLAILANELTDSSSKNTYKNFRHIQ